MSGVAKSKVREVMGSPNETALLLREWSMKSTDRRAGRRAAMAALSLALWTGSIALAGETVNARDLEKTFKGMTLDGVYYNSAYFTEVYREDGSIRYSDANGADSGKWSVKNGQFCTFYEGQEGACFTVEKDGANCFTFFEKDPDTGQIDRDKWTSRGWDRAKGKATCPTAPEVEI